jgi:hypothetical protein
MSTEVDMNAASRPAAAEPSVVRKWFQEGDEQEATSDGRELVRGGADRGSGMDDGLLDEFPEEAAEQFREDLAAAERAHAQEAEQDDEDFIEEGPTDRSGGDPPADPTRPQARYGQAAPPKVGARGPENSEELRLTNQELQRLLERREQEIAALRSQLSKTEAQLREKDEQLQLARRVLKSNGLG